MKYYLIAGEASGDLHASHLMRSLQGRDPQAEFRFFGGDLMTAVGGTRVRHYRELAYMGFVPVLLHLPTILRNMRMCREDISRWQPDVVILVDYPGFNLSIARYAHRRGLRVYYYIAPKIWAWKEYRIRNIRRDVDELFSILPFEVDFFQQKHHYPIHYVGNPTAQEVREFLRTHGAGGNGDDARVGDDGNVRVEDDARVGGDGNRAKVEDNDGAGDGGRRPVIALLAGSRRQEIKDNLPAMIAATRHLSQDYDLVVAGAPGIEAGYYAPFLADSTVRLLSDQTFALLARATAALVTSGTATLETCMFGVPQVVCYRTPLKHLVGLLRRHVLQVRWVSLVNLIAGREVVPELVAETFSVDNIRRHVEAILPGGPQRQRMLTDYREVHRLLGDSQAPDRAADIMIQLLNRTKSSEH